MLNKKLKGIKIYYKLFKQELFLPPLAKKSTLFKSAKVNKKLIEKNIKVK